MFYECIVFGMLQGILIIALYSTFYVYRVVPALSILAVSMAMGAILGHFLDSNSTPTPSSDPSAHHHSPPDIYSVLSPPFSPGLTKNRHRHSIGNLCLSTSPIPLGFGLAAGTDPPPPPPHQQQPLTKARMHIYKTHPDDVRIAAWDEAVQRSYQLPDTVSLGRLGGPGD